METSRTGAPDSGPEQQHLCLRIWKCAVRRKPDQPNIVRNKGSVTRLWIQCGPPHIYTQSEWGGEKKNASQSQTFTMWWLWEQISGNKTANDWNRRIQMLKNPYTPYHAVPLLTWSCYNGWNEHPGTDNNELKLSNSVHPTTSAVTLVWKWDIFINRATTLSFMLVSRRYTEAWKIQTLVPNSTVMRTADNEHGVQMRRENWVTVLLSHKFTFCTLLTRET